MRNVLLNEETEMAKEYPRLLIHEVSVFFAYYKTNKPLLYQLICLLVMSKRLLSVT